jgi:hypothetical protein
MTDRCPSIQEIENKMNEELKKEGLEPVEFAREFQKITRSGKRYGGMRGGDGECTVYDGVIILALLSASMFGGHYVLSCVSEQAMAGLNSAVSDTFQRGLKGAILQLSATLTNSNISDLGSMVKTGLAGVGTWSISEWSGVNSKVKEEMTKICAAMNAFRTGQSGIKWKGGRRRRSRRGGSRMSGGRRTRRRRSRAGTKRGGSCGSKLGGSRMSGGRRTRRRRAGSKR